MDGVAIHLGYVWMWRDTTEFDVMKKLTVDGGVVLEDRVVGLLKTITTRQAYKQKKSKRRAALCLCAISFTFHQYLSLLPMLNLR